MRYFIELVYNGKAYHGWQTQPNAVSVQETLEKALGTLLQNPTPIVGAGRTDAGVHASQMVAHFDVENPVDGEQLTYKLNAFLPNDIVINSIFKVKNDAHARFDAVSRSYLYRIAVKRNPFTTDLAYFYGHKLDIDAMNKACETLFQYEDFQCFSKSKTDVKTYNCTITEAKWTAVEDELHFSISANRFLRNMVRAIVGTMLDVGLKKIQPDDLHGIIKSKNRSKAGTSVPGHALFLTEVKYPEGVKKIE